VQSEPAAPRATHLGLGRQLGVIVPGEIAAVRGLALPAWRGRSGPAVRERARSRSRAPGGQISRGKSRFRRPGAAGARRAHGVCHVCVAPDHPPRAHAPSVWAQGCVCVHSPSSHRGVGDEVARVRVHRRRVHARDVVVGVHAEEGEHFLHTHASTGRQTPSRTPHPGPDPDAPYPLCR
jgi:hypothetical protein